MVLTYAQRARTTGPLQGKFRSNDRRGEVRAPYVPIATNALTGATPTPSLLKPSSGTGQTARKARRAVAHRRGIFLPGQPAYRPIASASSLYRPRCPKDGCPLSAPGAPETGRANGLETGAWVAVWATLREKVRDELRGGGRGIRRGERPLQPIADTLRATSLIGTRGPSTPSPKRNDTDFSPDRKFLAPQYGFPRNVETAHHLCRSASRKADLSRDLSSVLRIRAGAELVEAAMIWTLRWVYRS